MKLHRARGRTAFGLAVVVLLTVVVAAAVSTAGSSAGRASTTAKRVSPNGPTGFGSADLYIKDTSADTGVEPNPNTNNEPMWVSGDIGVQTVADPNCSPVPVAEPAVYTALPNESPEYRDPKNSQPNYVCVRVHNRGTAASSGTEQLHLYYAKASTGLAWPNQWVNDPPGTSIPLYGDEITKPRQNAATASPDERNAYINAVLAAGTLPQFKFLQDNVSYWHKQQEIHSGDPMNKHYPETLLPWHRELINRYEALLQQTNPRVKLLYWDWTTPPPNSGGFNFFTSTFMGASSGSIGPPFIPTGTGIPTLFPPPVVRNQSGPLPTATDASIIAHAFYEDFASAVSSIHGSAHVYIGGDMGNAGTSAKDPFFFLLHANADRLWAQWQRDVSNLGRLDPALTYHNDNASQNIQGDGLCTMSNDFTPCMFPWDGLDKYPANLVEPWKTGNGCCYVVNKTPMDPSIVSPPIYDTAPLVIPVLQPGQEARLQIPWYPPNPADFGGVDPGHFCLLARIETASGMTFTEGSDLYTNVKNNNNIAWKNITVVDNFPGAARASSALIRNVSHVPVPTAIHFKNTQKAGASFFDYGRITVDLKPALYKRWIAGGAAGQGIERAGGTTIRIVSPDAFIGNILLGPDEMFPINLNFALLKGYRLPRGVVPTWDVIQTGSPDDPNAIIGGQRFEFDFSKLVHVKVGDVWRYLDNGSNPGPKWRFPGFNDAKWKQGQAPFGYRDTPRTTISGGQPGKRNITTYFRRAFNVTDPSVVRDLHLRLRRNDGAVVYLNGTEIYRANMPAGPITPTTRATRDIGGLEREIFLPVPVNRALLHTGTNTIAVEIHLASPGSSDLSFDLELYSNPATTSFPPDVAIASPTSGALFQTNQPIPISVQALDTDGRVASVSFYADGKPIGTDVKPPYLLRWNGASLGPHRLRAVATDNAGQQAAVETTVTVLTNTPPTVNLTTPTDGTFFRNGEPISVAADASDNGGAVSRVDYYLQDMSLFTNPNQLVAQATAPPYAATLKGVAPGHYGLQAVAVDNLGATTPAVPVMIMIGAAP